MQTEEIIILIATTIILFTIILISIIHNKNTKIVKENSRLYKSLMEMNSRYVFNSNIPGVHRYNERCQSKRNLERFDFRTYLINAIDCNQYNIVNTINSIEENKQNYDQYCHEYNGLSSSVTSNEIMNYRISSKKFLKIENRLYLKNKVKPRLETTAFIYASYTSPKGRNSYSRSNQYSYSQIYSTYLYVKKQRELKKTREYQIKMERMRMTDSLRYDVLRRDNFKCQICGISAQDGAVLHIDHIIPVSRGGKTTIDNLQTLCERCNMGKSNKL